VERWYRFAGLRQRDHHPAGHPARQLLQRPSRRLRAAVATDRQNRAVRGHLQQDQGSVQPDRHGGFNPGEAPATLRSNFQGGTVEHAAITLPTLTKLSITKGSERTPFSWVEALITWHGWRGFLSFTSAAGHHFYCSATSQQVSSYNEVGRAPRGLTRDKQSFRCKTLPPISPNCNGETAEQSAASARGVASVLVG